jgi:hypothetical protein
MVRRRGRYLLNSEDRQSTIVNPLETVSNLTDVMLVLAVALMLALINFWNVDVKSASASDDSAMQPVEADFEAGESQEDMSGAQYEEVGRVYRDVATGDMFLLPE